MKRNIIGIIGTFLIIASCSKSGTTNGGGTGGGGGGSTTNCSGVTNNKFTADVNPIIQGTCATDATCHGLGSGNGPGPLLSYTQIFNARVAIKAAVSSGTMPKGGSLTTAQKNSIICWIDAGASNN